MVRAKSRPKAALDIAPGGFLFPPPNILKQSESAGINRRGLGDERDLQRKGIAKHADLESCAGAADIAGEALTEALAGRLSSREILLFGCRPCWLKGKAISIVASSQAACEPGSVGEPVHVRGYEEYGVAP